VAFLLHFPFMSLIGLVLVRTFKVPVSNFVSEVHRQTKIKLYKALIRSIVRHGSESFQRKVLREICELCWLKDGGETGIIMKSVKCARKLS
jgi:hypothetical protein